MKRAAARRVSAFAPNGASAASASAISASRRARAPAAPKRRHQRGLAGGGILAGGLADGGGVAFDVEQVVGDLERLADRRAIAVDAGARVPHRPARGWRRPGRQSESARRSSSPARSRSRFRQARACRRSGLRRRDRASARRPCRRGRPRARARTPARCAPPDRDATSARAITSNARVSRASPARIAVAWSNALCTVGRPRRRSSSSMAGRSSCTSE